MSFTGAEKLDDTGCWRAAAQCAVRSFHAVYLTVSPVFFEHPRGLFVVCAPFPCVPWHGVSKSVS
jgi:hypothetical protein